MFILNVLESPWLIIETGAYSVYEKICGTRHKWSMGITLTITVARSRYCVMQVTIRAVVSVPYYCVLFSCDDCLV